MKYILIFLLGLITFQVSAQTKIIGATTTAGGDLQGSYPNPTIKSNIINRANLTQTLRDSLLRFRKDTFMTVTNSTLNLTASANTLGKYNRVYIQANSHSAASVTVVLPVADDTLKNTEFVVNHLGADTTSALCTVYFLFDNFATGYSAGGYVYSPSLYLKDKRTLITKPFYAGSQWLWTRAVVNGSNSAIFGSLSGMTSLTGDVTGSGTGAVATTIANDAVTSAKILNSTIVSADIASQTVDSLDIKNSVITNVKLSTDAVTSIKVLDNSLTGSDLTYLTLRAGTTSNASLQLTSGSDKTTLTGGEVLYNGTRFAVGIGSSKRRIPVTNDVTPSNGQLPIGNGTDYTAATLTAGYAQTVTNGAGSITILPDTTKVIPYIPDAEIGNGTRDGYYKTQTQFGNQYYNGLYIKEDATTLSTNGSGTLNIRRLDASGSAYINYGIETGLKPFILAQVVELDTPTNNKNFELTQKGFETQAYYSSPSTNSQIASYVITGEYSVEHVDDAAVTSIALPEIVNTDRPVTGTVAPGYMLYLSVNLAAGVTISRAGSDTILQNGIIGSVTSLSTVGGTTYSRILIAVKPDVWMVY